jgi:hypothetical protein
VRGGWRVSGARDRCATEGSTYRRAGARMLIPSYNDLQRAFYVRLEALTGGECRGRCRGTLRISRHFGWLPVHGRVDLRRLKYPRVTTATGLKIRSPLI